MMVVAEWVIVIAGIIAIIAFCIMMYNSIAAEQCSITTKVMTSLGAICMTIGGLTLIMPSQSHQTPLAVNYYGHGVQTGLTLAGTVISIGIIWLILKRRSNDTMQSDTVRGEGPDWWSFMRFSIWQANIEIALFIIVGVIAVCAFIYNHWIA
jgi:hypothetical protein